MSREFEAARLALLADEIALERFPLLRRRKDWPPEYPLAPSGLTAGELREHGAFWQAVYQRMLGSDPRSTMQASEGSNSWLRGARALGSAATVLPRGALPSDKDAEKCPADSLAALDAAVAKAALVAGLEPHEPRTAEEWREVLRASSELKSAMAAIRARVLVEEFHDRYGLEPPRDGRPPHRD